MSVADKSKEKLIKIRAKIVGAGSYVAIQVAGGVIPRNLFAGVCGWSLNCDQRPLDRRCEAFNGRELVAIDER